MKACGGGALEVRGVGGVGTGCFGDCHFSDLHFQPAIISRPASGLGKCILCGPQIRTRATLQTTLPNTAAQKY